ncbi:hypothetical protein [Streptomyces sp. SS]|nr:hypothetical protein [Streptomyces sp. SS]
MTELLAAISRRYEQAPSPAQDHALRAAVAHDLSIQQPAPAAQLKEPQQ